MAVDHPAVFLLCLTFEGVVFGMAIVLFLQSSRILRKFTGNMVLVIANPLLFLFAAIHIIGVAARTYNAFITSGDPTEYYTELFNPETVVAETGQFGAILVSDLLSVYRVWKLLRANRWRTVIPAAGCVATFATAIAEIRFQAVQDRQEHNFYEPTIFRLTLSYLIASLITTASSTGLIVWDLWSAEKEIRRNDDPDEDAHRKKQSVPRRALRIFVESAALYSIVNLLWMAWFASRSIPEAIFSTLGPSTSSITFSLITMRLAHAVQGRTPNSSHHRMSNLGSNHRHDDTRTLSHGPLGTFEES